LISLVERYVAAEECLVVCRDVLAMSKAAGVRVRVRLRYGWLE
jgi:hypothetical protein